MIIVGSAPSPPMAKGYLGLGSSLGTSEQAEADAVLVVVFALTEQPTVCVQAKRVQDVAVVLPAISVPKVYV